MMKREPELRDGAIHGASNTALSGQPMHGISRVSDRYPTAMMYPEISESHENSFVNLLDNSMDQF